MKHIILIVLLSTTLLSAQRPPNAKISKQVMGLFESQVNAWNRGDLDAFMVGYWNDRRLVFVGSKGPTYGYENTLKGYRSGYPDRKAMGQLKFDILELRQWDHRTIQVFGKFTLYREKDTPSGHFTLLLRKIKGQWLIVSDHSS